MEYAFGAKTKTFQKEHLMSLTELFCDVDDFCRFFLPIWKQKQLEDHSRKRLRKTQLSISEIMAIMILFHQSNYRTFKAFYTRHVQKYLKADFPDLVSYPRFCCLDAESFWTAMRLFA